MDNVVLVVVDHLVHVLINTHLLAIVLQDTLDLIAHYFPVHNHASMVDLVLHQILALVQEDILDLFVLSIPVHNHA